MDTTKADGVACGLCGDDPATWERIAGEPIPLCDACYTDQTDTCPTCESKFWQRDGGRVAGELRCGDCYAAHPVIIGATMAGILADEKAGK
jgi:hypothetical protein